MSFGIRKCHARFNFVFVHFVDHFVECMIEFLVAEWKLDRIL